jgi:hypothetical protein
MFEQTAIAIQDEQGYSALRAQLDAAFDPGEVEAFLHRVKRAGLRVRDFEAIAARGLLDKNGNGLYQKLPVSDQGQIRECYFKQVERVAPELRQRYRELYAAY